MRDGATALAVLPYAAAIAASKKRARAIAAAVPRSTQPVDDWITQHFYEPETGKLMELQPYQRAVLRYVTKRNLDGGMRWRTVIWSQPKKSGKTTISGAVGRWATETWGPYQLVLFVGNDAQQAKERGFASLSQSVELTPGYDRKRRELAGEWRILDASAEYANGSEVKAIAADYAGEAGSNPSLTVYTELWGFIHTGAQRFWAEMAPSPTRQTSMRWVETYAGYEGESELLWGLYESTVKQGRQLTAGELAGATDTDLGVFAESPNPGDPVPVYINPAAGMVAFWDSGEQARRMPWQQGERGAAYYANEAGTQTPSQMIRLHLNGWVSAESSFLDLAQWDACQAERLPLVPGDRTPLVVALDAAVTGDCFGLVVVSRDTDRPREAVAVRATRKWVPPAGGSIDFAGPEATIRELCATFNVTEIAYDPYQLHDMATRLTHEGIGWFRPFPQGQDRLKADKELSDLVVQRRIRHDGNADLREHLANCNAKQGKEEDSKLRLTKKSETRRIDLAVCLSMASYECLRLALI